MINIYLYTDVLVANLFSTSYTNKETGESSKFYNLQVLNPNPTTKFDSQWLLNVDSNLWNALKLDDQAKNFIGKPVTIKCEARPFQNNYNLTVQEIKLK